MLRTVKARCHWKGEKAMEKYSETIPVRTCNKMNGGPVVGRCFFLSLLRLSQSRKPADGCRWCHDIMTYHKKDESLFSSRGLARALHSAAQISMAPACARRLCFLFSLSLSLFSSVFCWSKAHKIWHTTQSSAELFSLLHMLIQCTMSLCFLFEYFWNSRYGEVYHIKIIKSWMAATGCYGKLSQFLLPI